MQKLIARIAVELAGVLVCVAHAAAAHALPLPPPVESLPGNTTRFASIIAADIDADGDLDVIATDHALNLYVWVNDGAGHLTLQNPAHEDRWQPLPPAPLVERRPASCPSFTQVNPPSDRRDTGGAVIVPPPGTPTIIAGAPVISRSPHAPHAPRPPPLA
jgi:hypothetical protein